MLTVPAPALVYDPITPGIAPKEQPLRVAFGPVLHDGVPAQPQSLRSFALLSYRRTNAFSPQEVWDSGSRNWVPAGADGRPGEQLIYDAASPQPWQAIVVAAGGRDAGGRAQYDDQSAGFPQYAFAARFASDDAEAVSAQSAPVAFGFVADRNLMIMGPADGEKPDTATQARLLLRNTASTVIGGIVVRRDSPGAEVTVSNSAGAAVVLNPDGSIEVRPAPGRAVRLAGDVETERITYRPGGGGPKKVLG